MIQLIMIFCVTNYYTMVLEALVSYLLNHIRVTIKNMYINGLS